MCVCEQRDTERQRVTDRQRDRERTELDSNRETERKKQTAERNAKKQGQTDTDIPELRGADVERGAGQDIPDAFKGFYNGYIDLHVLHIVQAIWCQEVPRLPCTW